MWLYNVGYQVYGEESVVLPVFKARWRLLVPNAMNNYEHKLHVLPTTIYMVINIVQHEMFPNEILRKFILLVVQYLTLKPPTLIEQGLIIISQTTQWTQLFNYGMDKKITSTHKMTWNYSSMTNFNGGFIKGYGWVVAIPRKSWI